MSTDKISRTFFFAGGTMNRRSPSYVHRPADDELFNQIVAKQYCYVLTPRQMGKSSLMVRTEQRLHSEGVETAIIDLQELETEGVGNEDVNIKGWYLNLLSIIEEELDLSMTPDEWWQKHRSLDSIRYFITYLRDVVLAEIEGKVVIFIDEIDSTVHLKFQDDFFSAIRSMHNARATDSAFERLVFVMLGVVAPSDLIQNPQISPFNVGYPINLQEFSPTDAQVLQDGLESFFPGDGETIFSRIYYWTNGHPYLTQELCLAAANEQHDHWTAKQVDELVEALFFSSEASKKKHLEFIERLILTDNHHQELLNLYKRVYHSKNKIAEDKQSNLQNRLKLSGLVTARHGELDVRNEIYRKVFDTEWIKANIPTDWRFRIAVTAVVIAIIVIIGSGVYVWQARQEANQLTEALAQTCISNFQADSSSPEERLRSLACLFDLGDNYGQEAYQLFDDLSDQEKVSLFSSETSAPEDVRTVVQRIYVTPLDSTEENNEILRAMKEGLDDFGDADSSLLAREINRWLEGRTLALDGMYADALGKYIIAISEYSEERKNPGPYFDRAIAQIEGGEENYNNALGDLGIVIEFSADQSVANLWEPRILDVVKRYPEFYKYYKNAVENGTAPTEIVAIVPTPTNTSTPTPTNTHTPTSTNTPLPTDSPTPALSPTNQGTDTPIPTPTPTETSLPPPTPTPKKCPPVCKYDESPELIEPGDGIDIARFGKFRWEWANEKPLPDYEIFEFKIFDHTNPTNAIIVKPVKGRDFAFTEKNTGPQCDGKYLWSVQVASYDGDKFIDFRSLESEKRRFFWRCN